MWLHCLGEDKFEVIFDGTGYVSAFVVVFVNTFFLSLDFFLKPESLRKYKVQLHTNEPVEWRKLSKVKELLRETYIESISMRFLLGNCGRYIQSFRCEHSLHACFLSIDGMARHRGVPRVGKLSESHSEHSDLLHHL